MYNYAALASTVTRLVGQYGTPGCRVLRPSSETVSPDTPWKGEKAADIVVVASCSVLMGGISRFRMGGPNETLNKGEAPVLGEGSTAFMASADGAAARAGDYLEVPLPGGGVDRLAIDRITPLKPGGVNLLWQLALGD